MNIEQKTILGENMEKVVQGSLMQMESIFTFWTLLKLMANEKKNGHIHLDRG